MSRASILIPVVLASVVSCDPPQSRPPRAPEGASWVVLPEDQLDGEAEAEAEDDDDEECETWSDYADEVAGRKPVTYVKIRDWKPSRGVQELERNLRDRH